MTKIVNVMSFLPPASKYYNGKRYYTWETTAKGYDLGILPAECSNIKYWYVALT